MPLTDLETIKKLIQAEEVFIPDIRNERAALALFERSQMNHSNIVEGTEVVKIIRTAVPIKNAVNPTLTDQDAFNLVSGKIVPDTVVVADDALLTTVYVENDDYIIDYDLGTIERTNIGTTIGNGATVHVWYVPFVVLTGGSDYNFHHSEGQLNRRAGTTIPTKAMVFIDYTHAEGLPSDTLIVEMITEMESFIEPRLKPGFTLASSDEGLKTAASNYVMWGLCLALSFRELNVGGKDNSDDLAKRWQDLSKLYMGAAQQMFGKYLRTSTQQWGGMVQNRFVKDRTRKSQSPSVPVSIRRH